VLKAAERTEFLKVQEKVTLSASLDWGRDLWEIHIQSLVRRTFAEVTGMVR